MSANEDYKPNGRPQSTIAQNFSLSLNETFAIDDNPKLEGLLQSVQEKKQAVTSQSQELEALDAKLRETEARLNQKKKQSRTSSPTGITGETSSAQRRKPVPSGFGGQEDDRAPARGNSSLAAPPGEAASQGYSRWEGLLPQEGERA
ncbi:MAG: hypothetical protein HETSPECPRED_004995 [Heterodermia speciosa]|uniref:Uncharacterized protein n=1 Tax=Heterodermia speciosa TaxID=116794 RepID=A0A8H3FES6_9LECA|nr:MAG: hypothetical protein HETSPECPRED_004995 [Heterodermia speciosa]